MRHSRWVSFPPPPPSAANTSKINRTTVLLVVFSLLLCCGLPILPIYLWRKGKLPAWAGIGLAVAWVALYAAAVITAPETEPKPANSSKSTPAAKESTEPSEEPTVTPSAEAAEERAERAALVAQAEKLVLADLPDVPVWEGVTATGTWVSDEEVCVDRFYGPDGGIGGKGGNAGYVVVEFPAGELGEPQDGTCAKEGAAPAPEPVAVDVPTSLEDEPGLLVSSDFGDEWPLTVPYGVVKCQNREIGGLELQVITFTDSTKKAWAVNGTARTHTDYPDIDPIWADDPELEGAKVNISPVIDAGMEICENAS